MAYETAAALRAALEDRLQNEARHTGIDLERLRRRAVFERLLARLEAASPGAWVLKGGMALEFRLHDRARSTRDLDLALRNPTDDGDLVRELLIDALTQDPDGDGFVFTVGRPAPISADEAGRPGWRFSVEALLAGRLFANVRVDVVSRPEEIMFTDRLPLPGALAFAGVATRDVEAVEPAQHFAEKLHALTRLYGDRPSSRVRDLPDLVLLIENGLDPKQVLVAITRVFAVRGTHPVPEDLPEPPADWRDRYAELARELDVAPKTVDEAMIVLRTFWAPVRQGVGRTTDGPAPPS